MFFEDLWSLSQTGEVRHGQLGKLIIKMLRDVRWLSASCNLMTAIRQKNAQKYTQQIQWHLMLQEMLQG